jgi:integrase
MRASRVGPLALKAVRAAMVGRKWCRSLVNQRVGRVRRIFKWAASEELIPAAVYQALTTVTGLQRGRTVARETAPVGPVDDAVVDATLPFLNRHVRGLVEFQRYTGCQPGEACLVRRCDIEMNGAVWRYKPAHHKLAHRGKSRTVAVGPQAQEVLRAYFTPEITDYLFSPRRAVEELHAGRAAKRKTPRYPSHLARNAGKRVKSPKRPPAERYTAQSYGTAIDRACDKAFPLPEALRQGEGESRRKWWARLGEEQRGEVRAWRKAHRWSPNQLRHDYGTKARKLFDLEHAGAALGHTRMSATEVYAERDERLAAAVAAKLG